MICSNFSDFFSFVAISIIVMGFGDKSATAGGAASSWVEVARRAPPAHSAASAASAAESHADRRQAAGTAPKAGAKRAFKTVFTRSPVHMPAEMHTEVPVTDDLPPGEGTFVVGVVGALAGLRPTLLHAVFEGVEAGWLDAGTDIDLIRRERKGRAFMALRPQEHAPPGSALRRQNGVVTVRVLATTHPKGGILVPREWAAQDWWAKARNLPGVAAVHVREDRRLDLIPRVGVQVSSIADAARAAGLIVDAVQTPEGRRYLLTADHPEGAPVTAVARALRETVKMLESEGLIPLGQLCPRRAGQLEMPLLLTRPVDPVRDTMVHGMRVRVRRVREHSTEVSPPRGQVPPGPRPAVLQRKQKAADRAAPKAMDVDVGWEAEDVEGVEGTTFVAFKDTSNPVPAAGEGGFAAAGAATTTMEGGVRRLLTGAPEGVVAQIINVGQSAVLAPVYKIVARTRPQEAEKAIMEATTADDACYHLCSLLKDGDADSFILATKLCIQDQKTLPARWRELVATSAGGEGLRPHQLGDNHCGTEAGASVAPAQTQR